jgi:hypothetical protein
MRLAGKAAALNVTGRHHAAANFDFLSRHHGTPESKGGNTRYRLNGDTCNMASMAAIGVLCDNRAVYQQAVDYFKYGPSNGRVEHAAWMVHPDGLAQGEEAGRLDGSRIYIGKQPSLPAVTMVSDSESNILPIRT